MDWRQLVEPMVSVLRSARCAGTYIISRSIYYFLKKCYVDVISSQLMYHSAFATQAVSSIDDICDDLGEPSKRDSLVRCFLCSLDKLVGYVIDESGNVIDPYVYWRISLMVNPYLLWSYWALKKGLSCKIDALDDFLIPLRRSIQLDSPIDRHVHFESSLYPDDLMSFLLSNEGILWYSNVKRKMEKNRSRNSVKPDRFVPIVPADKRIVSVEKLWDEFPHYTLTRYGKRLWQNMIVSTWEMFVSLSGNILLLGRKPSSMDIAIFLSGNFTSRPFVICKDFPTLTRCLLQVVWNEWNDNRKRILLSDYAVFALILSNILWASFGDTRVEGLKIFAEGIYSHPLKDISKGIRKQLVKRYLKGKTVTHSSSKVIYWYERSILRRMGTSNATELRISLLDNHFDGGKLENTLGVIQRDLQEIEDKKKIDVVLHYIKYIRNEKERSDLIYNLFSGRVHKYVKKWVNETESTFLYLINNVGKDEIRVIAGIDAASDEMWTPVWLLAPFYRFWYVGVLLYASKLKLDFRRMTFHAGEDFLDIVSGIRRMFDVQMMIDEFGTGIKGIGHGIAFGVDPFHMGLGTSVIPFFDYFMNIWFLTYLYESYSMPDGYSMEFKGVIRKEMKNLTSKIGMPDLSLEDWMMMYPLLFKVPALFMGEIFNHGLVKRIWYTSNGLEQLCDSGKNVSSLIKVMRALTSEEKNNKAKILVSPIFPPEVLSVSKQEEIVRMLSDLIKKGINRKKITPEICVTSNMLIRDIKDPFIHPWASHYAENGEYSVGTDNPLFTLSIPELELYFLHRKRRG